MAVVYVFSATFDKAYQCQRRFRSHAAALFCETQGTDIIDHTDGRLGDVYSPNTGIMRHPEPCFRLWTKFDILFGRFGISDKHVCTSIDHLLGK